VRSYIHQRKNRGYSLVKIFQHVFSQRNVGVGIHSQHDGYFARKDRSKEY